jgi:hypothetical protein
MCGRLTPYFTLGVDRGVDKAIRVVDGTLFIVKTALVQNYPAAMALETIEILKR